MGKPSNSGEYVIRSRPVPSRFTIQSSNSRPFGSDWLKKAKKVPELKNVYDYDERADLLEGAHTANAAKLTGRRVLLFDDLYRSGATMNTIADALYDRGQVADVFALTITKTRSNR
jgi:predicted amidophosphoribosyltransferase